MAHGRRRSVGRHGRVFMMFLNRVLLTWWSQISSPLYTMLKTAYGVGRSDSRPGERQPLARLLHGLRGSDALGYNAG